MSITHLRWHRPGGAPIIVAASVGACLLVAPAVGAGVGSSGLDQRGVLPAPSSGVSLRTLIPDPDTPNRVLAVASRGSGYIGTWSPDAGRTWGTPFTLGAPVTSLVSTGAGATLIASLDNRVDISRDGGLTWQQLSSQEEEIASAAGVAWRCGGGRGAQSLKVSRDAGATWAPSPGLRGSCRRIWASPNGRDVTVEVYADGNAIGSRFVYSGNGGRTWAPIRTGRIDGQGLRDVQDVVYDQERPRTVVAFGRSLRGVDAIIRSTDGGRRWATVRVLQVGGEAIGSSISYSFSGAGRLWMRGFQRRGDGFFTSADHGRTWKWAKPVGALRIARSASGAIVGLPSVILENRYTGIVRLPRGSNRGSRDTSVLDVLRTG